MHPQYVPVDGELLRRLYVDERLTAAEIAARIGSGLTPAKSLTLRPLAVPDSVFADFLRGCIDGDGSVVVYADWYHTDKNERYVYERLYVTLVSGSWRFLDWIRSTVHRLISLKG